MFATQATSVLEIGTFTGYSSIAMAAGLPPGGSIISLEVDPHHATTARGNIAAAGLESRISVIEGPALRSLEELQGPFDLVFIDADKVSYDAYFEAVLPKLAPHGLIVVDNTLQRGGVLAVGAEHPHESGPGPARLQRQGGRRPPRGVRAHHHPRRRHADPPGRLTAGGTRRRARLPPPPVAALAARHAAAARAAGGATASGPQAAGVTELALTEHLFRFRQADALLGGFWDDERRAARVGRVHGRVLGLPRHGRPRRLRATAPRRPRQAGLPVVIGLEVDYYAGRMDAGGAPARRLPLRRAARLGALGRGLALRRPRRPGVDGASGRRAQVDDCWDAYTDAHGGARRLAAPATCWPTPT